MSGARVFFRADANRLIGTGHIARCRCLARTLRKQGVASSFLMAGGNSPVTESLEQEGFEVVSLHERESAEPDALVRRISSGGPRGALLIVDSPHAPFYARSFQDGIRRSGVRLMLIAFRSEGDFAVDALHNQNLLALEETYPTEPHTRRLLGPRYVILDERFSTLRESRGKPGSGPAETVFLFFGGADASNLTLKALRSLAAMEQPLRRVITVVGALHGRRDEISAFAGANPALPVDLHIDTREMPGLMSEADIALTSGGLTIWELACLGVPNAVISTSERERVHTPLLMRRGGCLYLGHENEVTEQAIRAAVSDLVQNGDKRRDMALAGLDLVDGRGTERVIDEILTLLSEAAPNERKGSRS